MSTQSGALGLAILDYARQLGIYIINFVFFIGISHAGTLISAVLRITRAEWRRPITRIAEAVTVLALLVGGLQVVVDLGRPDRLLGLLGAGRLTSPLIWDVVCITAYLMCSLVYLWLPLIPDLAELSRQDGVSPWRTTSCMPRCRLASPGLAGNDAGSSARSASWRS